MIFTATSLQNFHIPTHLFSKTSIRKVILLTLDWINLKRKSVLNGKTKYGFLQSIKNTMNMCWKIITYLHLNHHSKLPKYGKIPLSLMTLTWENILKLKLKLQYLFSVELNLPKCKSTTEDFMTSLGSRITSITRSYGNYFCNFRKLISGSSIETNMSWNLMKPFFNKYISDVNDNL